MAVKRLTLTGVASDVRELRAEVGEFKSEMRQFQSEMGEFKVETRAEFGNIREEIRAGDQETRTHMTMLVESLRDDFRIFRDRISILNDASGVSSQGDRRVYRTP